MDTLVFFSGAATVTLQQVLDNKEKRAVFQRELLSKYSKPLVCFTMNIPGEYKLFPLVEKAFCKGEESIEKLLNAHKIDIIYMERFIENTGCEKYYIVNADAHDIKHILMAIEEYHPIGRLFDIDVLDKNNQIIKGEIFGRKERTCLVCGSPVWSCARNRTHTARELSVKTATLMNEYFANQFADNISKLAIKAMIYEVTISPKPGLVDRFSNGSHTDMDIFTFIDSSCELVMYFRDITLAVISSKTTPSEMLIDMRYLGIVAEQNMFSTTAGINTHKGVIFSLGIICMAVGFLYKTGTIITAKKIGKLCEEIAKNTLSELSTQQKKGMTHGQKVFEKHKIQGIRGEAAAGFPSVFNHSLPCFKKLVESGCSFNDAGVVALLHLMANVDDTNIIHRSTPAELENIKFAVRELIDNSQNTRELVQNACKLDKILVSKNISPGGCADLLVLTLFLYWVEIEQ